jgi:transposase
MSKYNNLRKTWFYSNEFKIKAVILSYQPDIQSKQVLTENARLKKEVERLKKENDLLKKWQQFLAEKHQNDLDSSIDTDQS